VDTVRSCGVGRQVAYPNQVLAQRQPQEKRPADAREPAMARLPQQADLLERPENLFYLFALALVLRCGARTHLSGRLLCAPQSPPSRPSVDSFVMEIVLEFSIIEGAVGVAFSQARLSVKR
jgi:hypothetical protein